MYAIQHMRQVNRRCKRGCEKFSWKEKFAIDTRGDGVGNTCVRDYRLGVRNRTRTLACGSSRIAHATEIALPWRPPRPRPRPRPPTCSISSRGQISPRRCPHLQEKWRLKSRSPSRHIVSVLSESSWGSQFRTPRERYYLRTPFLVHGYGGDYSPCVVPTGERRACRTNVVTTSTTGIERAILYEGSSVPAWSDRSREQNLLRMRDRSRDPRSLRLFRTSPRRAAGDGNFAFLVRG